MGKPVVADCKCGPACKCGPSCNCGSSAACIVAAGSPGTAAGCGCGGASASKQHVTVLPTGAAVPLLTRLRDARTGHADFVAASARLTLLLAEEALSLSPSATSRVTVATPCGTFDGRGLAATQDVAAVSIVRSGDVVADAFRRVLPGIASGHILVQRDETTAAPRLYFTKLPTGIADKEAIFLCDPMLATGGSARVAIGELIRAGVREDRIIFVNVVACPEGLAALRDSYPRVRVVTAAIDAGLNAKAYIVPGLGDFGDRYFSTMH